MCCHVLVWWSPVDMWALIKDGDWVGHAISGWGDSGSVERWVVWQALAWPTELTDQRLIHVELRSYGTAAVEVQVVHAAQLAVLAQWWLTGCAFLLKVTEVCQRTVEIKCKALNNKYSLITTLFSKLFLKKKNYLIICQHACGKYWK